MASKAIQRRKAEKTAFRKLAQQGFINLADGKFDKGKDDSMRRDQLGGYRKGGEE